MHNSSPLFLTAIFFTQIFFCSSTWTHPGHLKPFGAAGPFKETEEYPNGFPDPVTFFEQYVRKSQPVLFRQALVNDSNFSLWKSDEQLKKIFDQDESIVHVETRKKESRQQKVLTMTMKEFLQRYKNEELYLVEEVPHLLRKYFTLPKCLQCPPAVETFQVAMMWFSSGNTSSVVHTDDYDNINCVLEGDKYFILIDSVKYPEVFDDIIDNPSGSYSSMDVDHVDFDTYTSLNNENVHYFPVKLSAGDCLFIPALWIHQVRSNYRNVAVNYWLEHDRVKKAQIDSSNCDENDQSKQLTLDVIRWPSVASHIGYLKDFMLDLVDDDQTTFKQWTEEFSRELDFDLQSNAETISWFAQAFNLVDSNENGYITTSEVDSLFDSDSATVVHGILLDILDIVEVKFGRNNRTNTSEFSENSEEDFNFDQYSNNITSINDDDDDSGETHEEL